VIPAIVHVASGREWRGGQRQVWLLARELQRRAIAQVVITGKDSELSRRLVEAGVPVRPAHWRAGVDPRVLPVVLHEVRHRQALLHAHDSHALSLAGIAAAVTRTPLIATRRVTFPLRHKTFWARAQRVIAISDAVRQVLIADGLSPGRVNVITSSIDVAELRASSGPDIRTRFGLPKKGQVAASLGALTPEKDHSTLLEAAALLVRDLPDLQWIIVGEGPLRLTLQSRTLQLGVQRRVHLVGELNDPHTALTGADIFVLSSRAEGLGSSLLAAMALEVPVVATRVGGVPEILGPEAGALVPAGDPVGLAAAVRRVLCEPEYAARLRRAARLRLERFSVSAMAEQVLEVYRSCAHSLDGS
jgi:L-malate glycosyltransferase